MYFCIVEMEAYSVLKNIVACFISYYSVSLTAESSECAALPIIEVCKSNCVVDYGGIEEIACSKHPDCPHLTIINS